MKHKICYYYYYFKKDKIIFYDQCWEGYFGNVSLQITSYPILNISITLLK